MDIPKVRVLWAQTKQLVSEGSLPIGARVGLLQIPPQLVELPHLLGSEPIYFLRINLPYSRPPPLILSYSPTVLPYAAAVYSTLFLHPSLSYPSRHTLIIFCPILPYLAPASLRHE